MLLCYDSLWKLIHRVSITGYIRWAQILKEFKFRTTLDLVIIIIISIPYPKNISSDRSEKENVLHF